MQDLIVWPNGMRLQGFGHYHETYEKAGDVADQVVDVDEAPHGSHRVGGGLMAVAVITGGA